MNNSNNNNNNNNNKEYGEHYSYNTSSNGTGNANSGYGGNYGYNTSGNGTGNANSGYGGNYGYNTSSNGTGNANSGYGVNYGYNTSSSYSRNNGDSAKDMQIRKKAYKNGLITGTLMGVAVILILMFGSNFLLNKLSNNKSADSASTISNMNAVEDKIKTIEKYLNQFYYEDFDEETLANGLYYGMTASLGDPYTNYYTPEDYEELQKSTSGEYCGIGVVVRKDDNTGEIIVYRVYSNTPASEAGIKKNDIVYSVDGQVIEDDMTTDELARLVVGEKNTKVDIQVIRDGETLDFTMTRKQIQIDTVSYEMKEGNIGYIQIEEFDTVTPEQVKKAIEELDSQGLNGIIIDLRDNPGGGLGAVKDIASMFIADKKLFLYSETKQGERTDYFTTGDVLLEDTPMVVLINENSASASEAFSGAMKCYKRATLVGTTSFGKGIMQSIYPLSDGSALKITIGKYYLPDGSNIHKIGITPDYEVEASEDEQTDPQLDKALEILR